MGGCTPSSLEGIGASSIKDNYDSVEEVEAALREAGLESCELIVAVDFTKSNTWTGTKSYGGHSLHAVGEERWHGRNNPYEEALSIIGATLSGYDDDSKIPAYGFGDRSTRSHGVFSFRHRDQPCDGLPDVLRTYRHIVASPDCHLSGPTSFAPAIHTAIAHVKRTGLYHVLVLVADGQVSTSATGKGNDEEAETIDAIREASNYALSIVIILVGDGPFDQGEMFDDDVKGRAFDNVQIVKFNDIYRANESTKRRRAMFARDALMELPQQYRLIQHLGLLGNQHGNGSRRGAVSDLVVDPPYNFGTLPPSDPDNDASGSSSSFESGGSSSGSGSGSASGDTIDPITL